MQERNAAPNAAPSTQHANDAERLRTLDGTVGAEHVVYVVGTNRTGYLPDAEPAVYRFLPDALDAMRALADDLLDSLGQAEFDMFGSDAAASTCGDLAWIDSMRADGDDVATINRTGCLDLPIGQAFAVLDYVGHVVFVHSRDVRALGLDADDLADLDLDDIVFGVEQVAEPAGPCTEYRIRFDGEAPIVEAREVGSTVWSVLDHVFADDDLDGAHALAESLGYVHADGEV